MKICFFDYPGLKLTAINDQEGNNNDAQVQHANKIEPESECDSAGKIAAPCWSVDILWNLILLKNTFFKKIKYYVQKCTYY